MAICASCGCFLCVRLDYNLFLTLFIGSIIGFCSGLFGIGGALIATPLLNTALGMSPFLALATPLPVAIPSALSGTLAYYKHKLIDFRSATYVLLGALPANLLGVYSTKFVSGHALMVLTGLFLAYVGTTFFIRGWLQREQSNQEERVQLPLLLSTGVLAGYLSGLLAIGGGIVMVPIFVRIVRMPLKKALATSLFCVAILALPSSIGHFYLGHIAVYPMFLLMITAIPFSYLGARTAIAIRSITLERIFGTFTIVFAIYFLIKHLS